MSDKKKDQIENDESVGSTEDTKKKCFVIMPISDPEGYTLGHFSRVYKHIIAPACEKAGFIPTSPSYVKSANFIVADMLRGILNADMAVCDLSSRNPNVLYELGIRQSFDLPVALIKDDKTQEIFDIQGIRFLEYDKELRIDLVEKSINSLSDVILETYGNKDKDIFSLVQILGRGRATVKDTELSADTLAILSAIQSIKNKGNANFTNYSSEQEHKYSFSLFKETNPFPYNSFLEALLRELPSAYNIINWEAITKSNTGVDEGTIIHFQFSYPRTISSLEFGEVLKRLSPNVQSIASIR